MEIVKTDVLVIGGGGAGLRAALAAKERGQEVLLVSKTPIGKSTCTYLSAGGFTLAAEGLTKEMHREETLQSGRGINDPELVRRFVDEAPDCVRELERFGVEGKWRPGHFSCQGKISAWGAPLTDALSAANRKSGVAEAPWVMIFHLLKENGKVAGALGYEFRKGVPVAFQSKATVLANGGGAALYRRHDNPVRTTGDGYALAYEAGCVLRDMEFVQFIPSGLAEPGKPSILVAVSLIDSGKLINSAGEDILRKYGITERPVVLKCRDSLSQAMFKEEKEGKNIFLDLTGLAEESWPPDNFAASEKKLLYDGCSCFRSPIRISPMCHFFMGGVAADGDGNTKVPGLFAAGEVVGGVHGANRLGGNALSEIIVFGRNAGKAAADWASRTDQVRGFHSLAESRWKSLEESPGVSGKDLAPRSLRKRIAELLWNRGGIARNERGLNSLLESLREIREKDLPRVSTATSKEVLEKRELENAVIVAEMIARSGLLRKESRGAHFREDFPAADDRNWKGNIFLRKSGEEMGLEYRSLIVQAACDHSSRRRPDRGCRK